MVLHGDLHHENMLFDAQAGWIVIDPKGVIGKPCLEMGRYLLNYLPPSMPMEHREEMVRDRVATFSDRLSYSP